jgi:hypothetical protein
VNEKRAVYGNFAREMWGFLRSSGITPGSVELKSADIIALPDLPTWEARQLGIGKSWIGRGGPNGVHHRTLSYWRTLRGTFGDGECAVYLHLYALLVLRLVSISISD